MHSTYPMARTPEDAGRPIQSTRTSPNPSRSVIKAATTKGPVKEKDQSQGREGGGGAAVRAKEEEEAPIVLKRRSTTPFMRGAARGGRPYSDAKPSTATPTLCHAAIPLLPHRRAVASASSTPGRVRLLDPKQIPEA
ncbi:hypothetical protein U9M48_013651 [Paspalum notatum var. saurae]|uniref:Uncharacterized protein n=1 Tax=Paspalum notatum var. saurae TaxID=547442 RepID=A0AAQ3T2A1_PASNO